MTTGTATTSTSLLKTVARSPLVPHAVFWGVALLAKVFFPVLLKWLAYDSISTVLFTVWYPLCATISLVHRNDEHNQQQQQGDNYNNKNTDLLQVERQYWIQYWSVGFAGIQFLQRVIAMFPSLQHAGRQECPNIPVVLAEIKLVYFVWIFSMEYLLERYQRYFCESTRVGTEWNKFVPLTFLTKAIGPKLMALQMAISEQISKETWQRLIHSKAQRVLEVLVLLQILKESSRDYLLQLLEEGRSLLLLSIFAVLPSSISQVGLAYVQLVFPSARSLVARGDSLEVLSLKYWVINNLLSLFLSSTWWLWWCVPFSTQCLLVVWSFATFPSTIAHYYSVIEMELITFGILSGEAKVPVKKTMTVQALRHVVKRLPRDKQASSFQFEIDDSDNEKDHRGNRDEVDESSVGSEDTTESEEERRRQRRREKRAQRKSKKAASKSKNDSRPPTLLSESFSASYDNVDDDDFSCFTNDSKGKSKERNNRNFNSMEDRDMVDNASMENLASQRSTISSKTANNGSKRLDRLNRSRVESGTKDDSERTLVPSISTTVASSNSYASSMELGSRSHSNQRKAEIEDFASGPSNDVMPTLSTDSMTIGSNYSSSRVHTDATSTEVEVATPTEVVAGEVEVQVRITTLPKANKASKRVTATTMVPSTYPKSSSSGRHLLMPSSSIEKSLSLSNSMSFSSNSLPPPTSKSKQDLSEDDNTNNGLYLSDIDSTSSSVVNAGSFEVVTPSNRQEKKSSKTKRQIDDATTKSTTTTSVTSVEASTPPRRSSRLVQLREWQEEKKRQQQVTSPSKSSERKPKKSTSKSPRKTPKKSTTSSSEKESAIHKPTAASKSKRVGKKSTETSTEEESTRGTKKSTSTLSATPEKKSRKKSEAPATPTSVGKETNTKPKKIPNSRRKKKEHSSIFGSVLSSRK